jgi:regulator of RNase E activity RraA
MSARAKAKGANGVVIDGRVRDLNEHRQMQFPVMFHLVVLIVPNTFVGVCKIAFNSAPKCVCTTF